MRNIVVAAFALLSLPLVASGQRIPYGLEGASVVRFECFGGGATARGRFASVTSDLFVDPNDLASARGRVEVELASIQAGNAGWEEMFRNAAFLAVAEHPKATFELTRVEGLDRLPAGRDAELTLVGRFTLRGVTRPMRLPATVRWIPAPEGGPDRIHVRASFRFRFTDHRVVLDSETARAYGGDGAEVQVELHYRYP